ncbi:MAG: oligoendopeptidase F [Chloroflexi bacterium HGW-Chloroflexi-2]|jgi:pepF/M3 family oligoendopeptidase|nr:MAG: oligoendopeptidase F [Chloroflexi bacterium HGW-Chloroflexi-2]
MSNDQPTRWDLSNIFPGLESEEFKQAFSDTSNVINELVSCFQTKLAPLSPETDPRVLNEALSEYVNTLNDTITHVGKVANYIYSFISTDSYNKLATRLMSEFEQLGVRLEHQDVIFKNWLSKISTKVDEIISLGGTVAEHEFALKEIIHFSQYLMSQAEEELASELNLSGASGWEKLQGVITSQLSVEMEIDGELKKLPAPALINLRSHPVEEMRKKGYEKEMQAWKSVEEPLAAALNGIKGTVITLNKKRGRKDAVESALDMARIDRETLEAMLSAMQDSFPMFRRYFQAKAKRFGQEKLPWWNLFAPVGQSDTKFSFLEARDFILDHFTKFSPDLADFAARAFDNNWIDAEQREGKMGGAFCMDIPGTGESRILSNFDGSLDQVSTLAHEIGHGFHNDCMEKANRTQLQQRTPMTMAETASIMCETIISNASLKQAKSKEEELAILEGMLNGDSQVIVDIYSRYLFEKEVFERCVKSDLSAEEFCDIMVRAQKATYGDGLDENYLHKYMWTWKPHYYSAQLSFYNFPYAFGLMFGTGLYAIYQERGDSFIPEYKDLLSSTGLGSAAELANRFGINIRDKAFWEGSLKVVEQRVNRYVEI